MSNLDKKLDFYVGHGLNVMFVGKQGIGKSSIILNCFKRNNLKFLYFSAATMDPWVDFVGVPKERKLQDGTSFIELVRPKEIAADEVDAIFFDEFNRAPKKVRNAVMELLQFKSINGHKLNNLKIIWAAINPDEVDDENFSFDVEKLDPAQKDRFHIFINLPYKLDRSYFSKKFTPTIADIANEWWEKLDAKVKNQVSPRRVDYALDLYAKGGDIRDVLPAASNVSKLVAALKAAPYKEKLSNLYAAGDSVAAAEFINKDNNFFACVDLIQENKNYIKFYVPLFKAERVAQCLADNKVIKDFVLNNKELFKDILNDIVKANTNSALSAEISSVLSRTVLMKPTAPRFPTYGKGVVDKDDKFASILASYSGTSGRNAWYKRTFIGTLMAEMPAIISEAIAIQLMEELLATIGTSKKGTLPAIDTMKILNTLLLLAPSIKWSSYKLTAPQDVKYGIEKLEKNKEMASAFLF
jgi:MoxR-like ATPase